MERQLFCTYLNWLKEKGSGRQRGSWNKTTAQRAQRGSNLDVGKISQVQVIYESIGWLNMEDFDRFL